MPGVRHQVDLRGMDDPLLFALIDAGRCAAKPGTLAKPNLDKHKRVTIKRDAINFSAAHPVVTIQYA